MVKTREKPQIKDKLKNFNLPAPVESNEKGDKLVPWIFVGLTGASAVSVILALFLIAYQIGGYFKQEPVNWLGVAGMVALSALTVWVARGLVWLAFFASVMIAQQMKAWKSQESLCKKALSVSRIIPGMNAWAAHVLVQSLITRGEFKEAITVGEAEYERAGGNKKKTDQLGPLCVAVALAHQVHGDEKNSIIWNERAIESLSSMLAALDKPAKPGKPAKQNQWVDGVRMQLAMAHFNSGHSYFKKMNHRQAKQHYQKAVEYGHKAPDSPEKQQLMSVAKEQLARLKHV